MNRSELIEKIGIKFSHLTQPTVEEGVNLILSLMTDTLVNDGRIEIRGFGAFRLNYTEDRIGRNPRTGAPCNIPAKAIPHFKPGKELRERVNGGIYAKYRYKY